jgi:hypothetical protein
MLLVTRSTIYLSSEASYDRPEKDVSFRHQFDPERGLLSVLVSCYFTGRKISSITAPAVVSVHLGGPYVTQTFLAT